MVAPVVSTLELRAIDTLFEMGGGYVLDFTDRTFAEFFREHGVQIDLPKYRAQGDSKAKRVRCFLRVTAPPVSGKVLAGLMAHRTAMRKEVDHAAWSDVAATAARLGGEPPRIEVVASNRTAALNEEELLRRTLDPAAVGTVVLDPALAGIILERMAEADRCVNADAFLAAVILAGSVLEALCIDFGVGHPERVNRAYEAKFQRPAPKLREWRLRDWIDVLGATGDLSPNIEKFGHGLRDFRNYVHPSAQLVSGFRPDKHTAAIALRVVIAAIDDLAAANRKPEGLEG